MTDIVLEVTRASIVLTIFIYLWLVGRKKRVPRKKGWSFIVGGFALIFFGMLIDITDNFSSLDKYVLIGDTEYQAFLEKVVGYLLGFLLLAVGFWKWMPTVISLQETQRELKNSHQMLESTNAELLSTNERLKEEMEQRKEAKEELRESKQIHQNVFTTAPLALVVWDTACRVTDWNGQAERTFGWSKEEVLGDNFFEFLIPESERPNIESITESLLQGELRNKSVNENLTKNGQRVVCEWNNSILRDRESRVIGVISLGLDVTEHKRMEEEKKNLEAQLVQAQKMQALGTLAGGIAHDFNNILFPAMGFTEMAMDEVPEDSTARSNMEEVLQATKRASELVKQILAFSRQGEQERKPLKVQPIIKEALQLLRASLPTTIEIRQQIDDDCQATIADPTQIHQVIMNLGTNAYHAMREKGGVLEVTLSSLEVARDDVITNPNLEPGVYLKLTLSDNGCGMDRDVVRRIFEPYYTTKAPGEGTGLGLSVVHGIVTSYGGDITVYSEPGKETTFNVYLPSVEPSVGAPEVVSVDVIPTGLERILLVDDEEQIVRMIRLMLERLGYRVTGRTSSVEALEAFRAQPEAFDLVVTDQTMPNMTGMELAQELIKIRPELPVILSTGFSEVVTERKAKAAGIKEYIMKPVVRKEIANTVRKVLDQHQGK